MRCVALVAAVLAVAAATATADPKAEKARADKLFDDGRKYLTAKEYALACTAFEQSQEADPAIGTQLNIALCYEQWGHVAAAYRAYADAEKVAAAKKDDRAKGAHKKVEELGPQVPHLVLVLPADADPSAVVLLDDHEVPRDHLLMDTHDPAKEQLSGDLLVEVGPHKIEGRVAGVRPKVTTIEMRAGQRERLVIDLPKPVAAVVPQPQPPPPPQASSVPRNHARLYGGLALAGVGAIALGVSIVGGLSARSDYAAAIGDCPMLQCSTTAAYQATGDARSRANTMTYVGGAGIALAAVGVVLIVTSHGKAASEPRTALAPMLAPGTLGLAIGGTL